MSSSSKQNANGKVISLGEEIHGKWSPPRTAHGTVKSFGKTKVKILLTEDFTKTHKKGMCIDIYFQNTWKDGREPPEGWKENFKWKTINPDKKGSRSNNLKKKVGKSYADYKDAMVIKYPKREIADIPKEELIRICMMYDAINFPDNYDIEEEVKSWDEEEKKRQAEEDAKRQEELILKKKQDDFMKEQMAKTMEANKSKWLEMFNQEQNSVQEIMEKQEVCENVDEGEEINNLDEFYKLKKKEDMLNWVKEHTDSYEDVKDMSKKNIKAHIKEQYE